MILDIETKGHELCVSYFDKNGQIDYIHVPVDKSERFVWEICQDWDKNKDDKFKTWDGKSVRKVYVDDVRKMNKYRIEEILFKNSEIVTALKEFNIPKKYFIDIEVEVIDGFPDPDLAQNRVVTISIANSQTNTVHVLGLKPLSEEECFQIEKDINSHFSKLNDTWHFRYFHFESEYDLLFTFFKQMLPQFPCISGWNFTGYDWKYLLNRVERINKNLKPDQRIKLEWSSPAGRIVGKNKYPVHRLIVDYLEIYKKWDRVIKIRENDKLDYVAKQAVGVEKIKYHGNLRDLYEKDFIKFVFYNAVDSMLVHYIDKKLNTMLTFLKLGHVAGVEAKKAFSPIWIMEATMGREFLKENKIFIYSNDEDTDQIPFEGAYVKEPDKGFHQWVTCYDFASLYPNTMMQFNISPETYVGKNIEPKQGEVKAGLHENDKGIVWRVFKNDSDSIMRKILKDLYGKRKITKQKYLDVNKEIDILTKYLTKTK